MREGPTEGDAPCACSTLLSLSPPCWPPHRRVPRRPTTIHGAGSTPAPRGRAAPRAAISPPTSNAGRRWTVSASAPRAPTTAGRPSRHAATSAARIEPRRRRLGRAKRDPTPRRDFLRWNVDHALLDGIDPFAGGWRELPVDEVHAVIFDFQLNEVIARQKGWSEKRHGACLAAA